MRLNQQETTSVVSSALESGVNLFDTADSYGKGLSEQFLGSALKGRRDVAVIATKFGSPVGNEAKGGADPRYIHSAIRASLKRLDTDYVDLYQLHRPDPLVPIEETFGALSELVASGLVREIGHSNLTGEMIDRAARAESPQLRFVSAQHEWSLVERRVEADVVPAAVRNGLAMLVYYPLASGVLTGKYREGSGLDPSWRLSRPDARRREQRLQPEVLQLADELRRFAESRGHSLLELAISWLESQPAVGSVLTGATSPAQITQNAAASSWLLSDEELRTVDKMTIARRMAH